MQVEGLVQQLRAEIAFFEQENLHLIGELESVNAKYELAKAILHQLSEER